MAQLFYKHGAMNSGKSIEILKVAHNYEEQDKPVLIFTPGMGKLLWSSTTFPFRVTCA